MRLPTAEAYCLLRRITDPDVFYSQPGARLLATDGTHDDVLAFANLDGSTAMIVRNEAKPERIATSAVPGPTPLLVITVRNEAKRKRIVNTAVAGTTFPIVMQLASINTLVVKPQSA